MVKNLNLVAGLLMAVSSVHDMVFADISNATVIEAVRIENVLASVASTRSAVFQESLHKGFSWINARKSESAADQVKCRCK